MFKRWLYYSFITCFALGLIGVLLIGFATLVTIPKLPALDTLTNYRPKIPLRIYSNEGHLIGEFGEERRQVVKIETVPKYLKQAILAAEDDGFYEHGGVDYMGILRAAYSNLTAGGVRQGASTITMQVARNFFLTRERSYTRKFSEILLSFKIEHNLSKDKILELYINQIYLGQRSYGFAAAAKAYFGKDIQDISLAEAAMLAGLPKAPSSYNPVVNPKRAKTRQRYVLRRMHELKHISSQQFKQLENEAVPVSKKSRTYALHADYVAEMARQEILDRFGESAYTRGLKVYTTITFNDQEAAYQALRNNLINYDQRHGFRGPESVIAIQGNTIERKVLDTELESITDYDGIHAAVVLSAKPGRLDVYRKGGERLQIKGDGIKLVQASLSGKSKTGRQPLRPGDVIRIQKLKDKKWRVVQLPQVEAALISVNPKDGAIRALIGGFDFKRNQFNHVTQAWRQPGSSFKPFIYSASLEKGFTPATIINDGPLSFNAEQTGSELWEPRNFDGRHSGPIRMRVALAKSKNLASIRILQAIGLKYAQDYVSRFGFEADRHLPYLPMALGSGSVTPIQMAAGYAVFANGGYRVTPYFIKRIEDEKGRILEQATPIIAGKGAKRIIDPRNAFIMTSMMQDVIKRGTATRAKKLGRTDLAGKTGTTSNFIDAWFCGFQKDLVTVAWSGFDEPKSLGKNETGGKVALPIWMDYMGKVLADTKNAKYIPPKGVITTRINPDTGLRALNNGITEYFFHEQLPPMAETYVDNNSTEIIEELNDQLF